MINYLKPKLIFLLINPLRDLEEVLEKIIKYVEGYESKIPISWTKYINGTKEFS